MFVSNVDGIRAHFIKKDLTVRDAVNILLSKNIDAAVLKEKDKFYLISLSTLGGIPLTRALYDASFPNIPLIKCNTEIDKALEILEDKNSYYCIVKDKNTYKIISKEDIIKNLLSGYRRSINRMQMLFNTIPSFFFTISGKPPFNVLPLNKRYNELFPGKGIKDVKNIKDLFNAISPGGNYFNKWKEIYKSEKIGRMETEFQYNNKKKWFHWVFVPIFVSGKLSEWMGICDDITLSKSEEIFKKNIKGIKEKLLMKKYGESFETIAEALRNIYPFVFFASLLINKENKRGESFIHYSGIEINKRKELRKMIHEMFLIENKEVMNLFKYIKRENFTIIKDFRKSNSVFRKLIYIGINSGLLIPIRIGNRQVFFLIIGFKEKEGPSDEFLTYIQELMPFLRSVGNNFLLYRELNRYNAELEKRVKERTFHLQILYEISQKIGYSLNYKELFKTIFVYLHKIVDYDIAVSVLYTESKIKMVIKTRLPITNSEKEKIKDHIIKISKIPGIKKAVDVNVTIIKSHDYSAQSPHPVIPFSCVFPFSLSVQEILIGEIYVCSHKGIELSNEQMSLIKTIINQGAEAVLRMKTLINTQMIQLKSLLEGIQEGIILLEEGNVVRYLNSSAEKFLDIVSIQDGKLLSIGGKPAEYYLKKIKDTKTPVEWELSFTSPERYLLFSGMRILVGEERMKILTIRDITEARISNKMVERQQRLSLIGQLAGGIAHDFNNILSAILGYAEYGRNNISDRELSKEALNVIIDQSKNAAKLVSRLLSFSREAVKKKEVINITAMMGEIKNVLRRVLRENINLQFSIPGSTPPILGDKSLLETVIMNLFVNAQDAMPDGGNITLKLDTCKLKRGDIPVPELVSGKYIKISVQDTGKGMDKDTLNKAFEPFFTTKPSGKGTGLGLFQVMGIVKNHNGYITIDSKKGKGTVVEVYLPIIQKKELLKITQKKEKKIPLGNRETILVVEDDPVVLQAIKNILDTLNYNVLIASDAEKSIKILKKYGKEINIVLTDYTLPDINGTELFKKMRTIQSDLRVIIMSGYSLEREIKNIQKMGLAGFIQKPFTEKALAQMLSKILKEGRKK